MPWSSHSLQHSFQTLINQLVDFHDQCGKQKNQKEFGLIRQACEGALDLLYKDEMPHSADQIVATISSGIYQTLNTVGSKKTGREDNNEFIRMLMNATRELSLFRNACEREIENKERAHLQSDGDVIENSTETIIPMRSAMTHLDSKQELAKKIASLGAIPAQTYSCFAFFKRTVNYYPGTMIAGGITGALGVGYTGLSILSAYAGPILDAVLYADQTGITHQAVIATTLLLSSVTLVSVAAGATHCRQAEDPDEEYTPLYSRV